MKFFDLEQGFSTYFRRSWTTRATFLCRMQLFERFSYGFWNIFLQNWFVFSFDGIIDSHRFRLFRANSSLRHHPKEKLGKQNFQRLQPSKLFFVTEFKHVKGRLNGFYAQWRRFCTIFLEFSIAPSKTTFCTRTFTHIFMLNLLFSRLKTWKIILKSFIIHQWQKLSDVWIKYWRGKKICKW